MEDAARSKPVRGRSVVSVADDIVVHAYGLVRS